MFPRVTKQMKVHRHRRGTAVVELAVCLPVLVLLLMGSLELCNFIYLKQSLATVAYETSREAIRPSATDASVQSVADNMLNARRLSDVMVDFPNSVDAIDRGQSITVSVSAPSSSNRVAIPRFVNGLTVISTTTMVKE